MNRACPLCGSQKSVLEISPEKQVDPVSVAEYWAGFLVEKTFFPFHRCVCGFLYCPRYPDESELQRLYSSMSDNEHSGNPNLERITKEGYAKDVVAHSAHMPIRRVLEVGADNGSLAKIISKKLQIDEYHCVEPNKEVHDRLSEVSNVFIHASLDDAIKAGGKFDAIIAVHVLDHIRNLDHTLDTIHRALRTGGLFYAVVHNEKSLLAKLLGRRWPAYCLQHPHLFNKNNLPLVLRRSNYAKFEVRRTKNYFSFGYLFSHLVLALFRRKIDFRHGFSLGLKLGNLALIGVKGDD